MKTNNLGANIIHNKNICAPILKGFMMDIYICIQIHICNYVWNKTQYINSLKKITDLNYL